MLFGLVTKIAYANTFVVHLNHHLLVRDGCSGTHIKFHNSNGGHFVLANTDLKTHISAW